MCTYSASIFPLSEVNIPSHNGNTDLEIIIQARHFTSRHPSVVASTSVESSPSAPYSVHFPENSSRPSFSPKLLTRHCEGLDLFLNGVN